MPLAHLSDRAIVKISGADATAFLQGQLTSDISALSAETPLYAGVLTPQGKALFPIFLFADGADILVDVADAQADALVKRFTMFRLRRQFTIDREPSLAIFAQWGEPLQHPHDPRLAAAGSRFVAAADSITPTASLEDWHAHRLPLGLPEADEIGDSDLMWLETNARELNGVSFTKGCYTGQENVARMHHRDKLRKRLLPVRMTGVSDTGDGQIMAGAKVAGELRGQRRGDWQMALVRMDHADGPLTIGDAPVSVVRPEWLAGED